MKCPLRLVLAFAVLLLANNAAHAKTFVVSDPGDTGPNTLREAIIDANSSLGADVITFSLPTTGNAPVIIPVASELPAITEQLTINGYSQSGATANTNATGALNAVLKVILDGTDVPTGVGLTIFDTSNCIIQGLNIRGFDTGIMIGGASASGNKIQGNFIGTDETGLEDLSDAFSNITIDGTFIGTIRKPGRFAQAQRSTQSASNNLIGGGTAATRNLISGAGGTGILVFQADTATIQGNLIGTTKSGTAALGNTGNGITLNGSTSCQIGGAGVLGNVISGNGGNGIGLLNSSTSNKIQGNKIGTTANGLAALGNTAAGVLSSSNSNTIGGATAALGNVISGNAAGISITATSNSVLFNYIGVGGDGATAIPNTGSDGGLRITGNRATGNVIGLSGQGNVISGNTSTGLTIDTGGTATVKGNTIGLAKDGVTLAANGAGVSLSGATNTTIGGTAAGEGNVISGNAGTGVLIAGNSTGIFLIGNKIGTDKNGTAAKGNVNAVFITGSSGVTVGGTTAAARNLISGNANGVIISGTSTNGNNVTGNYIGTNAAGTAAIPNGNKGIIVGGGATANVIGGSTAAAGNLISGNGGYGVSIEDSGTNSNVVRGNFIGTTASGSAALTNAAGLAIQSGAQSNVIGGSTATTGAAPGNVIGGNVNGEVFVIGTGTNGNIFTGNLVGTNAAGTAALKSNTLSGNGIVVIAGASRTVIGGNSAAARNVISGNNSGVQLEGTTLSVVQGNYIGTTITGLAALPNLNGVIMTTQADDTVIGGLASTPGQAPGNLVSGNTGFGIHVGGNVTGSDSNDSSILGNIIGLDKDGANKLSNGFIGVGITDDSTGIIVGGTAANERNIISGNTETGVFIDGTNTGNNQVQGNYIGTNLAGNAALGNGQDGIKVTAKGANNLIGGTTAAARNIISGNGHNGVLVLTTTNGPKIQGNYIGTTVSGNADLGNGFNGVQISDSSATTIGGGSGAGNVISGNDTGGVAITESGEAGHADGNTVQGNIIGVGANGTTSLPNGGNGVLVSGHNNHVGGLSSNLRNTIRNNTLNGVEVSFGDGNDVRANNISNNGKLGIDLLLSGDSEGAVTPNDALDADNGPNNLTNIPTLQSAIQSGSSLAVKSSIQAAPGTTYSVDIFSNTTGDASGFGEGETYLASSVGLLTTDSTGNAGPITTNISGDFTGKFITLTATDNAGNTSEFSQPVLVSAAPTAFTVNSNADTDDGACTASAGGCTLREALSAANAHIGADNIKFNIPGSNFTITPATALPAITDPVTIDGYTQPGASVNTLATGNNAKLKIVLRGGGSTGLDDALDCTAPNVTVRGLVINNFKRASIVFIGNTVKNSKVVGCFIGTNAAGTAAGGVATQFSVVLQEGASVNAVGGPAVADRNVISGNDCGIALFSGATANTIENNYIGVNAAGNAAIPNTSCGLLLAASPEQTVIGGTTATSRNIISGNHTGVSIDNDGTDNNKVLGNYIGLSADGTKLIGNTKVAIEITSGAQGNIVGGTAAGSANVICGSPMGVNLDGNNAFDTSSNTVAGNFIGTDAAGKTGFGNVQGVVINNGAKNNLIGGTTAAARNVIAGNTFGGVSIDASGTSGNTVAGNFIGISAGEAALGNGDFFPGVSITNGATNNVIGGTSASARNIISGQTTGSGVLIQGAGTNGNTVSANYIGLNIAGTAALANGRGVTIDSGAKNNIVGGLTAGARNVISGCEFGVGISTAGTTGNLVRGNYLGTNAAGTGAIPNRFGVGLSDGASGNTIGGTAAGSRNLISGNTDGNIFMHGVNGNTVAGNFIGTNAAGTASFGSFTTSASVILTGGSTGNTIGGTTAAARNIISGAAGHGLEIQGSDTGSAPFSSGNIVSGNYIGTDVTGTKAVPNGSNGVIIFAAATGNTIGGAAPGAANLISGNSQSGVVLFDANTKSNVIAGNLIGTDVSGTKALGNQGDGVLVTSGASQTTVGGLTAGERNVISANGSPSGGRGVHLVGETSGGNSILGNYLGTNAAGTSALGNAYEGVFCDDSPNNTIGGTSAAARNLISGNGTFEFGTAGVAVIGAKATGNVVQGNYIGTNASGGAAVPNKREGVYVNGSNTSVLGNLISGNTLEGVRVSTSLGDFTTSNAVRGNLIGVNAAGTAVLGNETGIRLDGNATGNTIGGVTPAERNIISGNRQAGILIESSSNLVQGNVIGSDAGGTLDLGNKAAGVDISSSAVANTVGGTGNLIAFNDGDGINLNSSATRANLRGNQFIGNGGLPINLQPSGEADGKQTANDSGDGDAGPNNLQNFPTLTTAAVSGSNVTLTATLNSAAAKKFDVDLYKITGSGMLTHTFRVSVQPTTNSGGNVTFNITTTGAAGDRFAVMATDAAGNSSEISPEFVVSGGTPGALSLTMDSPVQEGVKTAYHGTVSRGSASTATALPITIVASPSGQLNIDPVKIPAGASSITFNFFVVNNPTAQPNRNITVTASATGFTSASDVVQILDDDPSGGQVFAWGYNQYGQVGNGTVVDKPLPVNISLNNVRSISANGSHSLAAMGDGSVRSWGYNGAGQLGDGTQTDRSRPVTVSDLGTSVVDVAAGWYHSLALKSDGTVWAWGFNNEGQLGDGSTIRRLRPVRVTGLTKKITAIAAGVYFSLALAEDGTVYGWGNNFYGQLGDGTHTRRLTPVQVQVPAVVTAIAAGGGHSLFLKGNGQVWSCGWNTYGQLGQGSTADSAVPAKIVGLPACTGISAGYAHSVVVDGSGNVFGFGDNSYGQIGARVSGKAVSPSQINALSGVSSVQAGADFSLFVLGGGAIQSLGNNNHGQLGKGTIGSNSKTPVNISSLQKVGKSSAGYGHALVIGESAGGALKPVGPSTKLY